MSFSIIAAVGKNGEIGTNNKLPWDIPEDLKRFRDLTRGHTVIMGRKTFESIGRPLPNRKNIIITRNSNFVAPEGCIVVNSVEDALATAKDDGETFVIGGSEIYRDSLPHINKMYITSVEGEFSADTYFPEVDFSEWRVIDESSGHRQEREGTKSINFSYITYERVRK